VLDARGSGVPTVLHWGADLGATSQDELTRLADALVPAVAHNGPATPLRLSLLPMLDQGWQGRPGLDGAPHPAPFALARIDSDDSSARVTMTSLGLDVTVEFELTVEGLLRSRATVVNTAEQPYRLSELGLTLPLPAQAAEVLDFTGRWAAERRPQRRRIADGAWSREARHGRDGHDSAYLMVAGTEGFGFRSGQVWGLHVAWSGNQRLWVERAAGIAAVGGGELLAPGEMVLTPGSSYSTPWIFGSWSDEGLDGMSRRFHGYVRRTAHSDRGAHPMLFNTLEAAYFDHDDARLGELARLAAEAGVERFVLDDGWMTGRTGDTRGLGDWTVDRARRPEGLGPLIQQVTELGMDFGLWVEPEMVTPDSAIAQEHPDWLLRDVAGVLPPASRHQFALDLSNEAAFDHVLAQLDALLAEYPIAYLKWDHNRDLLISRVHGQAAAASRLMAEVRSRHPGVEIEACASGGGRIDLSVLESAVRVWPSDDIDALERQAIYRWTTLLVPPEIFGAHLGASTAHVTGRTHSLSYRLATALFGWSGIECDLRGLSAAELASIADWVAHYKNLRGLLHSGDIVRADRDDSTWVHGIVAPDASEAVFSISAVALSDAGVPAPIRLPGLDPSRSYDITPISFAEGPRFLAQKLPPWIKEGGVTLGGALLESVGLAAPPLAPEQAMIVHVRQHEPEAEPTTAVG